MPPTSDSRNTEPLEILVDRGRFPINQTTLGGGGWKFRDTRVEEILEKVRNAGTLLEEVVLGSIHHGIITGYDKAFVIDIRQRKELIEGSPKSKSLIRPLISDGEIVRYGIPTPHTFHHLYSAGLDRCICRGQGWLALVQEKIPCCCPAPAALMQTVLKYRKHQGDFWWECAVEQGAFDQNQSRILFSLSGEFPAFLFDAGASIPDRHTQFINLFKFLPARRISTAGLLHSFSALPHKKTGKKFKFRNGSGLQNFRSILRI